MVSKPIYRAMSMMMMMHKGIDVGTRTIGSVPSSGGRRSRPTMKHMRAARSHVVASGSRSHRLTWSCAWQRSCVACELAEHAHDASKRVRDTSTGSFFRRPVSCFSGPAYFLSTLLSPAPDLLRTLLRSPSEIFCTLLRPASKVLGSSRHRVAMSSPIRAVRGAAHDITHALCQLGVCGEYGRKRVEKRGDVVRERDVRRRCRDVVKLGKRRIGSLSRLLGCRLLGLLLNFRHGLCDFRLDDFHRFFGFRCASGGGRGYDDRWCVANAERVFSACLAALLDVNGHLVRSLSIDHGNGRGSRVDIGNLFYGGSALALVGLAPMLGGLCDGGG